MTRLDRATVRAIVIAAVLVVLAVPLGVGAARLAAPAPTPTPGPTPTPLVFPTPPPDPAAVFRQPLSAGCATDAAVWVVSDGGGIGRFDGTEWALVDGTLRSLVAAACTADVMSAAGGAGRIVYASDTQRTIRPETVHVEDLNAISLIGAGAMVAGSRGTVLLQDQSGWAPHALGIDEDLYGLAAFSPLSAWAVGAGGTIYRLEEAGWRRIPSGVTVALRAVAATKLDDAIAVGDDGALLAWDGAWQRIDARTGADLRAVTRGPAGTWAVGDSGTLLRVDGARATTVDLGTTCHLRAVFGRGREIWVVGSDATRASVWRLDGDARQRWGTC